MHAEGQVVAINSFSCLIYTALSVIEYTHTIDLITAFPVVLVLCNVDQA
jgi:uncharacterized membrane protein